MNILKMKGIAKLPLFSYGNDGGKRFDFNKIIPMPEPLNVESGSKENLAVEVVLRKLAAPQDILQKICVVPNMSVDLYQRAMENSRMSEDELCKLGLVYIRNKVLYGATSWYYWCCKNWGTKWNSYENEEQDEDTISFETAWSPPEEVIARLAQMYPDAVIEHWWADEDAGNNSGYAKYMGKEEASVNYYEADSSKAYETYVFCWGESQCLYQDDEGLWHHKDCDKCQGC